MKHAGTPGTVQLAKGGYGFTLHPYDYDAAPDDHHKGIHAAQALGQPLGRVYKTLMVELDGKPGCVVIPVAQSLSMKKVAAHFGAKHAEMMPPAKAERMTGYRVGGISPFGQKKRVPVVIEASARDQNSMFINAGKRGLLLEIASADAIAATGADFADICAD